MVLSYAAEVKLTNLKVNLADPDHVGTQHHANAFPGIDPATIPHPDGVSELFVRLTEASYSCHGEIIQAQNL